MVHEPLSFVCQGSDLGTVDRTHDAQHPVGSDAETAVAQAGNLLISEFELRLIVRHKHEIIARAVPLEHVTGRSGHNESLSGD